MLEFAYKSSVWLALFWRFYRPAKYGLTIASHIYRIEKEAPRHNRGTNLFLALRRYLGNKGDAFGTQRLVGERSKYGTKMLFLTLK